MNRREFVFRSSGLVLSVCVLPSFIPVFQNKMDRIGMGTVLFRDRFKQTKPNGVENIANELALLDVPEFYRQRFGIDKVEFWSTHFESLEPSYLNQLKSKLKATRAKLINVQIDSSTFKAEGGHYNLAATDENERQKRCSIKRYLRKSNA